MKIEGKITKAHGSGGKFTHDLIKSLFVKYFDNDKLRELSDSAVIGNVKGRIIFTTDSHVVKPLFYPGGNIGKLAIAGTINDLAVSGAKPLWLSCSMIIEEGFEISTLEKIVISMKETAESAKVEIVTGDTKVVEHGAADGLYINTAGIGVLPADVNFSVDRVKPGDKVLVSGYIGDHEAAIITARKEFNANIDIKSDCAPLNDLTATLISESSGIKVMRDPTRGGLVTILNEFASSGNFGIRIFEESIPIREEVRGLCEPLGFDPLYMANEGKVVLIVAKENAEKILSVLKSHPLSENGNIIGEVVDKPHRKVLLRTIIGTERVLDMLTGVMLPRIC
jgi:hydrogenase expression/formation protein HypE